MLARVFLCFCTASMLLTAGGGWANAAEYVAAGEAVKVVAPKQDSSGDAVQTAVSREEAIKIARSLLPEILEGKELQAELDYYMQPGQRIWRVTWDSREPSPFGPPEHIFIVLDSQTGDLLNADFSLETQQPGSELSLIAREEALKKAEEMAKKMRPEEFVRTRLEEGQPSGYYGPPGVMKQSYDFFWQRYENGLRVEGDGIGAGVNALNGQVQHYSFSWHRGAEFPAPGDVQEAAALAGRVLTSPGLYLGYSVREGTAAGAGGLPEAFLLYQPNSITSFFDPRTGEPVDAAGNKIAAGNAGRFDKLPAPVAGAAGADPPGAPGAKVGEEDTQKTAEEFFRKIGAAGRVIRSGGGSGGYGLFRDETRSYTLADDRAGGRPPQRNLQVMVNISTGEVDQYFNSDFREAMSTVPAGRKPALTREQALDKAGDFIRLVDPERFKQTVINNEMSLSNPKLPDEYYFQFTRLVNGLPFWREGIDVSVDAASGEIRRYNCRWHQAYFPDPAGAIKAEEAAKMFLEKVPMELVYFFPRDESAKSAVPPVLAYRFGGEWGERGLDAVSGQLVNVNWMAALPVTPDRQELPTQHWAALPLALLAESGLLPAGKDFSPDSAVTRRDVVRIIIGAGNVYYGIDSEEKPAFSDIGRGDRDFMAFQTAVRLGFLTGGGEFKPDGPITRETMAVWLVRALGHEDVAAMPGKIELPVKDADLVDASLRNYVAIACGLGLMTGDENGCFRPQDRLTWAELAAVVTKAAPRLAARLNRW